MRSKMRSGAVALVMAAMGACGAVDEEPRGSAAGSGAGSPNESSQANENHGSGHPGKHEDNDKQEDYSNGDGRPEAAQAIEIEVAGGEVRGVSSPVEVAVGERVEIEVVSDTHDEVHVHGYDLLSPVAPSKPARIGFVADLPGAWEVELEGSGLPLFELRVQ